MHGQVTHQVQLLFSLFNQGCNYQVSKGNKGAQNKDFVCIGHACWESQSVNGTKYKSERWDSANLLAHIYSAFMFGDSDGV